MTPEQVIARTSAEPVMKFFNIGKANAEIERLQKENEALKAEAQSANENAEAIEREAEKAQKESAERIAALEKENSELKAAKEKAESDAKAAKEQAEIKIAHLDAEVDKQASAKALQITAGQGQPPVTEPAKGKSDAPAAKELKGFERVVAAFKAQSAEKALTK